MLAENRAKIAELKEAGPQGVKAKYFWLDSSLDGGSSSFYSSFKNVLPENVRFLREYIEETLKSRKGEAVGVEFGGIGLNAFGRFTPDFFKKSVGLTLVDHRDYPASKRKLVHLPNKLEHRILEGDMFSLKPYRELERVLAGAKVDLILERLEVGLNEVPKDPLTIGVFLSKWYELLNEGGLMLVQVPGVFNPLLLRWAEMIERDYPDVLEFQIPPGVAKGSPSDSAFRLRKLPGAPAELPLLRT